MTLDARARRAAHDFSDATEDMVRSAPELSSFERFDHVRRRKQRNSRIGVMLVASAVAIVAIIFVARALPRAERPASTTPRNGRIVFVRFGHHPPGARIPFTMDPDGTDETRISFPGGVSGHGEWPHWSPDGTRVAVFCCPVTRTAAHIVNLDTGAFQTLPLKGPEGPEGFEEDCGSAWSPDGRLIACGNFGYTHPRETGVWVMRSSDGGLTQVTSNPHREDDPGDFSPDGAQLVFVRLSADERPTGLFVIGVDGSGLRQITPPGMLLEWFSGSWSPTGNQILFVARADRQHKPAIWEVNADGSDLHQVPIAGCGGSIADPSSIACSYPGWSPDGTKIVFTRASDGGNRRDIAIVNADGSGLVQITHTGDADEADWGTHPLLS